MARTRVVLRRNGSKVGEVSYASEAEAVARAAQMQGAASGLEALLAPAANRKPRRNPSDAVFRAVGRYIKSVNPDEADYAKEAGFGSSDLAVGKYADQQHDDEGWNELVAHVKATTRRRNPSWTEAELVAFLKGRPDGVTVKELVYGFGGTSQAHTKRLAVLVDKGVLVYEPWAQGGGHYLLAPHHNGAKLTAHQAKALRYIADNSHGGRYSVNVQRGEVSERTAHALEKMGLVTLEGHAGTHQSRIGGFTGGGTGYQTKAFTEVRASLTPEGQALAASLHRNPSIGRGTKHRDTVAKAITKRLRGEGVPKAEAVSRGFAIATAAELRKNPTQREALAQVVGMLKKAGMPFYKEGTRHEKEREGVTVRLGHRKGTIGVHTNAPHAAALMAQAKHITGAAGWRVIFDNADGGAIVLAPPLKQNPTPIDIASLDFAHFKRTTVIKGYYNVRTGRRFARVASKDGTFITDVPVSDGGNDGHKVRGADAIKKRAYEQLRIHIEPTTWKPSVRVNPGNAGSVRYGGTTIRIADGIYTVQPHGPAFSGPDGFVSAKRWIDTHGA